jgi:hypothetical protein
MVRTIAGTGGSRAVVESCGTLNNVETFWVGGLRRPARHTSIAGRSSALEALRSLVDAVVVRPGERRGEVRIELRGAGFLHYPTTTLPILSAYGPGAQLACQCRPSLFVRWINVARR